MSFDLICGLLAGIFALVGAIRGLLRQIFGIAGFIGGLVLARFFAGPVAERWHGTFNLPLNVMVVVAGVLIFFVTGLMARILAGWLTDALGTFTGTVNRVGGGLAGLAKGLLAVWVLASLAALVQPHLRGREKTSEAVKKLDLEGSRAIAIAKDTSILGEKAKELRARAEKEIKARTDREIRARAEALRKARQEMKSKKP